MGKIRNIIDTLDAYITEHPEIKNNKSYEIEKELMKVAMTYTKGRHNPSFIEQIINWEYSELLQII